MPIFSRQPAQKPTRIFFATDIHGSEIAFRKFVNAGKFYEADVLILGGDVAGKLLIPIVAEGGKHRARLQGTNHELSTEAELAEFKKKLGVLGFYWIELSPDEYAAMKDDTAAVEQTFVEAASRRLQDWVALAEERLKGTPIRCFITGGNDDPWEVLAALDGTRDQVVACEGRVVRLDDHHTMVSLGYSNETPWRTPREITEDELTQRIAEAVAEVADFERCIFNFHCPPKDSTLDTCPMLDTSTDPPSQIVKNGQVVLFGAGSTAVRAAIHDHQPMLGLHGHIHESRGMTRIGRTVCFNPGSEYGEGILRGVLVSILDGKMTAYQMTSG